MTEHTKCSIVVHYELDKGIESEKNIFCIVLVSSAIIRHVLFAVVWRKPGAYII